MACHKLRLDWFSGETDALLHPSHQRGNHAVFVDHTMHLNAAIAR
jgi:hypothetical protein